MRLPDLDEWLLRQVARSRARIAELERSLPGATRAQLAQRLIDEKKQVATGGGAVVGLFGILSIPADVALIAWLQVELAIELAVLHRVNLNGPSGRADLLDILGFRPEDLQSAARALPALVGRLSAAMLRRTGWRAVGRAVPVLAAPIAALVASRDIQRLADEANRRFGTFRRVPTARIR